MKFEFFRNWHAAFKQFFKQQEAQNEEILSVDSAKNVEDNSVLNKNANSKKLLLLLLGVVGLALVSQVIKTLKQPRQKSQTAQANHSIQTVQEAIDGSKSWQEFLENELREEKNKRVEREQAVEAKFAQIEQASQNSEKAIAATLEAQLQNLKAELTQLRSENEQVRRNVANANESKAKAFGVVSVQKVDATANSTQQDVSWYIPAATYVKGALLHGVATSTAVTAQSDPTPVIIRLTDSASLPGDFSRDVTDCRVLASCFGDLSSERVNMRLEKLSCVDRTSRKAIETSVSGFVVGSDGIVGIKGRVVSMDAKYLNYATLGGVLSGVTSMINTNSNSSSKGININLGDQAASEAGSSHLNNFARGAADRVGATSQNLMEYYIKKAESIQPVIEVPAGVKVDIVFTQGGFLGSKNIKNVIEKERR